MANAETAGLRAVGLLDSRFVWKVFFVFLALAIASIAISSAGRVLGRSIAMAGHTDDTSIAEVVIGNNVISAPRNMIRFEGARRGGVTTRLDLYLRWPSLDGYTDATRDDFNHSGQRVILFATLTESMMSRDMSGRFEPIYSHMTTATGQEAAGGLAIRNFTSASGYANEILLTGERPGMEPFVIRCLDGASAAESLAPCERDIHLGDGLSATYRMPKELLGEWKSIDEAIRNRIAKMVLTSR